MPTDGLSAMQIQSNLIDHYFSLPRMDRMAVYRSLSVSDRMRLDRQIIMRKAQRKKKPTRGQTVDVSKSMDDSVSSSISPWLLAHIDTTLEDRPSDLGQKTRAFIKAYTDDGWG